jgi:WD40-like Beta Propeller Repeat
MNTPELERRIRTWFADEIGGTEAAPSSAYAFLDTIPQSIPRPQGLFGRLTFLLAAALLIGLLAGAVAVGSGIVKLPSILPPPAPSPLAIDSPGPSTPPATMPLVFYRAFPESGVGVWVANADGTGAHELIAEDTIPIELSADGRLLGFSANGAVSVADVIGPEPRLTNIRGVSSTGGFSFSPNGTKLAFVQRSPVGDQDYGPSVIAIMDLSTGSVAELDSTAVRWPDGSNWSPKWSPDGSQLVFARLEIGIPTAEYPSTDRTIYVVNADGSDLRQLVPTELFAWRASWSPDGSRILFTSTVAWLGVDEAGNRENSIEESDVYSVRPDGGDLRPLTTDTVPRVDHGVPVEWGATGVSWTREGRIIFTRVPLGDTSQGSPARPPTQVWVMDPDGRNQRQLDRTDLAELTAAGCVVCPYPSEFETVYPGIPLAYWQPAS